MTLRPEEYDARDRRLVHANQVGDASGNGGVSISLEVGCGFGGEDAVGLFEQLSSGRYDLMSVLPCPPSVERWRDDHRTARKRANRAFGRQYRVVDLLATGGPNWDAINRSTTHRQGRPMSAGYREATLPEVLPDYPCPRHAVRATGVRYGGTLVAYLVMLRAGELALVSQILGHADHLDNDIMYLLFQHALQREIAADPDCFVVYNRWDSGTDGLRYFKERLGFEEQPVEWLP